MNALNMAPSFEQDLNHLYKSQENLFHATIEYKEPYTGRLGSYSAEIYHPGTSLMNQMLERILSLQLTTKWEEESRDTEVDVIKSSLGLRGGLTQLIFVNDRALTIFKEAIQKEIAENAKKEKFGRVPFDLVIQTFPELKDLIIDSRRELSYGVAYIAKDAASSKAAEVILRKHLEDFLKKPLYGLIKQCPLSKEGQVLIVSFDAIEALEKLCKVSK